MLWFAPLVKMVGQQVGLELLRTAGREVGRRLQKSEAQPMVKTDDGLARRVQTLEVRLEEQKRELTGLADAVAEFSVRFERFIGRALLISVGSLFIAVGAVTVAIVL